MGRATDCSGALHLGLQGLDLSLKANLSGLAEFHMSPARATTKAPLPRGQRKTLPVVRTPADARRRNARQGR
jgi:hypothetical protein